MTRETGHQGSNSTGGPDAPTNSALRLTNKSATSILTRKRRRSDTDRPTFVGSSFRLPPHSIRSRDGKRWLPTPEEQAHTVAVAANKSIVALPSAGPIPQLGELDPHKCNREASRCALARVLNIPELHEGILSFLDTRSVLTFCRISRRWQSAVHESPYLRLQPFALPQWRRPASQLRLLPLSLPGLTIERKEATHFGQRIEITMTRETARRIAPIPSPRHRLGQPRSIFEGLRGGLGSSAESSHDSWPALHPVDPTVGLMLRSKNLYITQPPAKALRAFSKDDDGADVILDSFSNLEEKVARPIARLSCDAGITIGLLAQMALSLLDARTPERTVVFEVVLPVEAYTEAPRNRLGSRQVIGSQ